MRSLHSVQFDRGSISGKIASAYRFPINFSRRGIALKFARMAPSEAEHPSMPQFKKLEAYAKKLKNLHLVWGDSDPILGRDRLQDPIDYGRIYLQL